jgi:hypothetical protein
MISIQQPLLTITARTIIKSAPISSSRLSPSQRRSAIPGEHLTATSIVPGPGQHWLVVLDAPVLAEDGTTLMDRVYVYQGHADDPQTDIIQLDVPYYSQMDNESTWQGSPRRQCSTSSHAMMVDFVTEGALAARAARAGQSPDTFYGRLLWEIHETDTTDSPGHTRMLKEEFGIVSEWRYDLSPADVAQQLAEGRPVVVGLTFGTSGHIVCVSGFDASRSRWLIEDPFGVRHGASNGYDIGANGSRDPYSWDTFERLFTPEGPNNGWGRIITEVGY